MAALSYKAERRQMDTDQKAKHQPGGMIGVGVGNCGADQRGGQTEGEIHFCGLRDYLNPSVFPAYHVRMGLHTAHYQTNEMLCKTEGLYIFLYHTLEGFAASICQYGIPFTHG